MNTRKSHKPIERDEKRVGRSQKQARRTSDHNSKALIAKLRQKICREAMMPAARNTAIGAEACLAVHQTPHQPSPNVELVALLEVADDAKGDGDVDLPSKGGRKRSV